MPASKRDMSLADEIAFRQWWQNQAQKYNYAPNPDDPLHYYDYRGAFMGGAQPGPDAHWPSIYKIVGHPNQFVNGLNTITDTPMTDADLLQWIIARQMRGD